MLALELLAGLITYFAVWHLGLLLLRTLDLHAAEPFTSLATPLAGLLFLSFIVQILADGGYDTRAILIALWCWLVALWLPGAIHQVQRLIIPALAQTWRTWLADAHFFAGIAAVVAVLNLKSLLLNDAPLTDPSVMNQVALAPLRALAPHADVIVSWSITIALAAFVFRLIIEEGGPQWWAEFGAALVLVCSYLTASDYSVAQAVAHLAITGTVCALYFHVGLRDDLGDAGYILFLSLCTACAAMSNVALGPFALAILLTTTVVLLTSSKDRSRMVGAAILPWFIAIAAFPQALHTQITQQMLTSPLTSLRFAAIAVLAANPCTTKKLTTFAASSFASRKL